MMRPDRILARTIALFAVFMLFGGCARVGPPSHRVVDLAQYPGNTFRAKFTDNTVRMDRDSVVKNLRGINSERSVLLFDNSFKEAKKLTSGSVLLIPGVAALKIVKVVPVNSQVAVQTGKAALTDLIKDGVIRWDYPVNFRSIVAWHHPDSVFPPPPIGAFDSLRALLPGRPGAAWANPGSGCGLSGKFGGWEYTMKCSSEPDRLSFDFDLKKELGGEKTSGASVGISGTGYIQNFQSSVDMSIQSGTLVE